MQILLTAFATILAGALTLSLGQIIVRGGLEPALELKRLIGTIASDLHFHANRFSPGTPAEQSGEIYSESIRAPSARNSTLLYGILSSSASSACHRKRTFGRPRLS